MKKLTPETIDAILMILALAGFVLMACFFAAAFYFTIPESQRPF